MYGYSGHSSGTSSSSSGMLYGGPLGAYLSGIYSPGSALSGAGNTSSSYGNNSSSSPYSSSYSSTNSPYASSGVGGSGTGGGSSGSAGLRRSASTRRNIMTPSGTTSSLYAGSSGGISGGSTSSGLSATSPYTPSSSSRQSYTTSAPSNSSSSPSPSSAYFTPQMARRSANVSDSVSNSSNVSATPYTPSSLSTTSTRYRPSSFKSRQSESPTSYSNNGYDSYRTHHASPSSTNNSGNSNSGTLTSGGYKSSNYSSSNSNPSSFTSTARISPNRHQQNNLISDPPVLVTAALSVSPSTSMVVSSLKDTIPSPAVVSSSSCSNSSTVDNSSRPTSRSSSYVSRTPVNLTVNYKELYDAECRVNDSIRTEIETIEKEINEFKQVTAIPQTTARSSRRQELEMRRLERKEAEYDELMKQIAKEMAENEKLKAENAALEKVVRSLEAEKNNSNHK